MELNSDHCCRGISEEGCGAREAHVTFGKPLDSLTRMLCRASSTAQAAIPLHHARPPKQPDLTMATDLKLSALLPPFSPIPGGARTPIPRPDPASTPAVDWNASPANQSRHSKQFEATVSRPYSYKRTCAI